MLFLLTAFSGLLAVTNRFFFFFFAPLSYTGWDFSSSALGKGVASHRGAWSNRELGLQASSLEPPNDGGAGGGGESKEVCHVTEEAPFFFSPSPMPIPPLLSLGRMACSFSGRELLTVLPDELESHETGLVR